MQNLELLSFCYKLEQVRTHFYFTVCILFVSSIICGFILPPQQSVISLAVWGWINAWIHLISNSPSKEVSLRRWVWDGVESENQIYSVPVSESSVDPLSESRTYLPMVSEFVAHPALADLGGTKDARPPSGPKFLHLCSFRENWSNNMLAPLSGVGARSGKSWIRHCTGPTLVDLTQDPPPWHVISNTAECLKKRNSIFLKGSYSNWKDFSRLYGRLIKERWTPVSNRARKYRQMLLYRITIQLNFIFQS